MAEQSESSARLLVRALYYATEGEPCWWRLPANLNDRTKEAITVAVDRGWMFHRCGHRICRLAASGSDGRFDDVGQYPAWSIADDWVLRNVPAATALPILRSIRDTIRPPR